MPAGRAKVPLCSVIFTPVKVKIEKLPSRINVVLYRLRIKLTR